MSAAGSALLVTLVSGLGSTDGVVKSAGVADGVTVGVAEAEAVGDGEEVAPQRRSSATTELSTSAPWELTCTS